MSYNNLAEADIALGHVAAWSELTDDADKSRRLDTATLWLSAGYALPITPTPVELTAIKLAETTAVRYGFDAALFPSPGETAERGSITKERRKVDVLEIERTWAAVDGSSAAGRIEIAEVDAILSLVGIHPRTSSARVPVAYVV